MALSLLLFVIFISVGALMFANVSSGISGSMSSTYLVRPVFATLDTQSCTVLAADETAEEYEDRCGTPWTGGGGSPSSGCPPGYTPTIFGCAEEILVCAPPYVKEGNQCVEQSIFGDPQCTQGIDCLGDPRGADPTQQPWDSGDPSSGGSSSGTQCTPDPIAGINCPWDTSSVDPNLEATYTQYCVPTATTGLTEDQKKNCTAFCMATVGYVDRIGCQSMPKTNPWKYVCHGATTGAFYACPELCDIEVATDWACWSEQQTPPGSTQPPYGTDIPLMHDAGTGW